MNVINIANIKRIFSMPLIYSYMRTTPFVAADISKVCLSKIVLFKTLEYHMPLGKYFCIAFDLPLFEEVR